MAAAAEQLQTIPNEHDAHLRFYDDTTTLMAEMLDGSMRTVFDYYYDGHDLYSHDGGALKPLFKEAIRDAEKLVAKNPNLAFELRRRWTENGELNDMLAMASGDAPNTMVTVSDFPPELMDATEDVGGYNVRRKQTMLRVITRQADGSLRMYSQSLDGSDRQALESIYHEMGFDPEAGELLGQRMHLEVPDDDQEYLIDKLMGIYDRSMQTSYGGNWYPGRQPVDYRNTYEFVCGQTDLLEAFTNSVESLDQHKVYNLAAALQNRYTNKPMPANIHVAPRMNPLWEMQHAGNIARAENKSFSGCGITLNVGGSSDLNSEFSEQGYGNQTNEETKYNFDKKMHCVVCQQSPKKDEAKKMCGPCGICRTCDAKLKKSK